MKPKDIYLPEVLFEFSKVRNFVRVTAVDPISGIETTMVGSSKYGKEILKRLATRKLKYVISKRITLQEVK